MSRFLNKKVLIPAVSLIAAVFILYFFLLSSPQEGGGTIRVIIPMKENGESVDYAANFLYQEGAIKNKTVFRFALAFYGSGEGLEPGAYIIESGSNVLAIAKEFRTPDEKWVMILEGLRKEEIAGIFGKALGWSKEEEEKFINEYADEETDYFEGVYFPDTYLVPVGDSPEEVAARMIARFNEKFAPYADKFVKENIKWTTALKIASLVEREAGGKEDMPIIAGVLWNRLLQDMKLDVDATVQYARGDTGNGWWAPITTDDKKIDSPYNTYLYKGLPPHPISNPGIDAIEAVLNPAETKCLYYLHASDKQIHCAVTYEEHLDNIDKYLK